MKTSGYDTPFIRKVMMNGLKSYEGKVEKSRLPEGGKGYSPLHHGKRYNAAKRLDKKLLTKNNWYKGKSVLDDEDEATTNHGEIRRYGKGKGGSRGKGKGKINLEKRKPSTVMFVNWTDKGTLAEMLKFAEDRLEKITGFRIRITEEAGTPLWRQLSSSRLDDEGVCGRTDCETCRQPDERKLDCFQRSVVYESACAICHPGGIKVKPGDKMIQDGEGIYVGETSRSIYERTSEHHEKARSMDEGSFMVKHWFTSHPEEEEQPGFRFRVVGKFKDCLTRQLKEAVRMGHRPGNLNSKGEWGSCNIPRLIIEKEDYAKKKDEIEARKRKEKDEQELQDFINNKKLRDGIKKKKKQVEGMKRKLPEWMTVLDTEQGSPAKRKRGDEDDVPDGWKTEVSTEEVPDGWSGSQDMTVPAVPDGSVKNVMKDEEFGPDGQNTMAKITTDERSTTGDNRGILIRGGRKGKGQPLFNVRDIAAQFRTMASNHIVNKTPKRKTDEDWVDSPSKKCKLKLKLNFEEE